LEWTFCVSRRFPNDAVAEILQTKLMYSQPLETKAKLKREAPLRLAQVAYGADEVQEQQARAALASVAQPPVELVEPSQSPSPPALYIILLSTDRDTWSMQIAELAQAGASRIPVVAAVMDRKIDTVREALRAGASDVLFLPFDGSDLARVLLKIAEARQMHEATSAQLCALTSLGGGAGVSSITAALALALPRLAQRRVAVIDLSLQNGALAALLDVEVEHTIAEIADPTSTIDSIRLESVLSAHRSGVYLLAAPHRIEESELISVSTVTAALNLIRQLFDVVLIDSGHHLTEGVVAAWEHCHSLMYVVEQSVTSVRPAQRFLGLFERLNLPHTELRFVLNRFDPANPFTMARIEEALKTRLWATIPRDDHSFIQLQLESVDLAQAAPRSHARTAIDLIARELAGIPEGNDAGQAWPGWLGRLRSIVRH
jgi:pilus assembly protein CpaE